MDDFLSNILEEILTKRHKGLITFLTGAGISADSGIPTYRSADGIWVKGSKYHKPEEFGTFEYFKKNPEEVWQFNLFRKGLFEKAKPNENHLIIQKIEDILLDKTFVITQNIDRLHLRAGTKRLYEIHGNLQQMRCMNKCKKGVVYLPTVIKSKSLEEDLSLEEVKSLKCTECGHWMRPNILWFDEYYDEKVFKMHSVLKVAKNSGLLLILGTSGATNLPKQIAETTLRNGGYVVEINLEDNHFTELLKGKKRGFSIRSDSKEVLNTVLSRIEEWAL